MMKNKIYISLVLGLMGMGILCGCDSSSYGKSTIEPEVTYNAYDVDYTTNNDGTYTCRDNIYKYKIGVTGMEGESQATFFILTNDEDTSFEDVSYSLKKAESTSGIPEFVILGYNN